MKQVLAYVSLDGSLHSSKQEATIRSLQYLVEHLGTNAYGQVMLDRVAGALFSNRKQVIEILTDIEEQTA